MNSLPIVWEKIKLREIIKLNYGKSLPEKNRKDGQISVYGSNGIIGKHNEALVHYSTIVIGRKGSVGKASLSLLPCWVIDTAFYTEIINPNINLKYLYLFCLLLESNVIFPKGVKPGINREEYLNNEIILPFKNNQPDLDGQKYIVNKIDKSFTEAKKGEYLTKITLSNVIKILHSELKNTFTTSNGLREIPLGDICQTTSGGTPNRSNREYYGGRIPWLKSGELNDNQNIGSSEEFIT
jgi:type I restriction enzyme S subunit